MGLNFLAHKSYSGDYIRRPIKNLNPDPNNFNIVQYASVGDNLVVKLNYPDCRNYEGNKVMLYRNMTLLDLANMKTIDPHFAGKEDIKSPFARFEPTGEGWEAALLLAKNI